MEMLMPLLFTSGPRALFVILFVVGLAMAVARRAHHPNASRLAIVAFSILIAGELLQVASQVFLFSHTASLNPERMRIMGFFAIGSLVLSIAGMTLLVLAVFADRNSAPSPGRTP